MGLFADRFRDRVDAGRRLSIALMDYANRPDVTVLGLPRGGVPVAAEVATALSAPLDICVVRKLGAPSQPELAIGAIAEGGARVMNLELIREIGLDSDEIDAVAARELAELEQRVVKFRGGIAPKPLAGRIVILIDDGLATGATMEAAIAAVRQSAPARIIAAAPVGATDTCRRLEAVADEVVCPLRPSHFYAVGQWYEDFYPTTDDEVTALLRAQPL